MHLVLSPEARLEFEEAERYYNRQSAGLGDGLRDEIRGALKRIRTWPIAFPVERGEIRRALLGRFPYKILYSIEPDHIYSYRGTSASQTGLLGRPECKTMTVLDRTPQCPH